MDRTATNRELDAGTLSSCYPQPLPLDGSLPTKAITLRAGGDSFVFQGRMRQAAQRDYVTRTSVERAEAVFAPLRFSPGPSNHFRLPIYLRRPA